MSFLTAIAAVFLVGVTTGNPSEFVIMQFSAKWCEPCKEMEPAIERLAQQGWIIRNVDIDLEKSIVQRMKVTHLPTLLVLKDGREIDRITGVHSSQELAKLLPGSQGELATKRAPSRNPSQTLEPFPMLEPPSTTSPVQRKPEPMALATGLGPATDNKPTSNNPMPVDPMSTTVRIKTEDENSVGFGTGTMIDQMNGEVLVLTCGHMFRDLKPSTRVTVEAPVNGQLGQFNGTVIDYKYDDVDIGLLSFKPGVDVPVAKLLPVGSQLREGESVASFGCDAGADPTRRDSQITKLNRYLGPSNVEVAQAPVQGRSGGGLFNQAGQLIGVCYAADKELDEGLYSGPEVVYAQLSRLGLTRLYSEQPKAEPTLASSQPSIGNRLNSQLVNSKGGSTVKADTFPDQMNLNRSGRNQPEPWQQAIGQAEQVTRSNVAAIAAATSSLTSGASITATIRDSSGRERTVSIPNPSPALLQMLEVAPQTAQLSNSVPTSIR